MVERAFATGKGMLCCFSNDRLFPSIFYEVPYSL